jgi:hypothetical protein
MKHNYTLAAFAAALAAAGILLHAPKALAAPNNAVIMLSNNAPFDREKEAVEVSWEALIERIPHLHPDSVIVKDNAGIEIASQTLYKGGRQPCALLFEVSLAAGQSKEYQVSIGRRSMYPVQAYGRYVPTRMEDYAWENNMAAYRVYGRALEWETISIGIDYWAKTTPQIVQDAWYARDRAGKGSYHKNMGEGNDCYKTGRTLGAGGSAIVHDGGLVMPANNYHSYRILDNGPLRTSVELWYPAFAAGGDSLTLTRTITLDANTYFNDVIEVYHGGRDTLHAAVGVVMHKDAAAMQGDGWLAVYEPASDSRSGTDGMIGTAALTAQASDSAVVMEKSMVYVLRVAAGASLRYMAGAAASKAGVSQEQWYALVQRQSQRMHQPIAVKIK